LTEKIKTLSLFDDRISDFDISLTTQKGEEKKLWNLKANNPGLKDSYLCYAKNEQNKLARLTDRNECSDFYIKRVPQHLINFTNEEFYQIIYSPAHPSIHDKFVEGRLMLDLSGVISIGYSEFTMWRIKKHGEDSNGTNYIIQEPSSNMVLSVWNWVEDGVYQIYGVPENQVDSNVKVTWTFEKSYEKSMIGVVTTKYNSSILDEL
jgi:hypothetical protein